MVAGKQSWGIFTPWTLANAINQGFFFLDIVVKLLPSHHWVEERLHLAEEGKRGERMEVIRSLHKQEKQETGQGLHGKHRVSEN